MTSSWFQDPTLLAAMLGALLPFVSFVLIMVFTRPYPKLSATISVAAVSVSLICALSLLGRHWHLEQPIQYTARWMVSGKLYVPFGFMLDQLSLLMLTIVAGISFLVQVYSLGYMAGDPGFARYYAFQSLFAWAMMTMSIAPTMLQFYIFWELVGLASYFLIGFYYEKFSASEAGKKAFVMTRLGDIAFFLGLLLVLLNFGNLNILDMNSVDVTARMSPAMITLSAILIFGGVAGKSAQFPLLTWLPDAMEGPTPVSALLHSATMVAAGVYMFARIFPFFSKSPTAMTLFLAIGTITMLLASTMAMVTRDIKQVWAFSTISQLGFMVMGLAAGSYFAGIFHLTTHAGFKALLFLCSGVFIHEYETNDFFEIGQHGGRGLKVPIVCITLAAAALSGLPPLSGFFSKEAIMGGLAELPNPIWLWAGLLGAFLTAYYSFRLIFAILFPKKIEEVHHGEHGGHGHGEDHHHAGLYWVMAWPLIILAAVTLVLGFFQAPLENFLVGHHGGAEGHGGGHHAWLLYVAVGLALSGVGLAWLEFGRKGASQVGFVERLEPVKTLFAERWYIDHFYRLFLDYVIYGIFSNLFTRNDRQVIDGGIDGLCRATVGGGRVLSFLQSGMLQYNLMVMFAVLALVALYFFF
ncbi:MAG: NADH-quinone oxidoreductase subunit L [Deltaproteobacteria bacterium]|nr:NADH-quinone oxidoreductase subunit L [Deltaproteobacteria bacterium]PNV87344.1 MAG: NADH-quinone oxidoreductase subunit L [Desulfobacteraceae bacterium]MDH3773417.1 NADH-quinone oxidoreductase subunit L [Deltaproteobacteria bacterium]MDH3897302.1 NADH-quinone oxidoreductase subunit L [Deltaproteobacteria bacterium]MDH3928758.1 NADH-quinone oxidoreductase subunit L [Deltaproteobacteria bacterium]